MKFKNTCCSKASGTSGSKFMNETLCCATAWIHLKKYFSSFSEQIFGESLVAPNILEPNVLVVYVCIQNIFPQITIVKPQSETCGTLANVRFF